jgi:ribonuclease G
VNKELIINSSVQGGVEIALLEDKKLVELHYDNSGGNYNVGDLYLGKIRKVMTGLNAVFVDIGHEKDAFLHYTDLSPYFKSLIKFTELSMVNTEPNSFDFTNFKVEPEIEKNGKITEVFTGKPNILVQILKEPISSKGPRISCEVSLPGRFIVLTPFNNFVNVSRKIASNDERKRLQRIMESIKPNNFGVIVRTAAEGQSTAELHKDMLALTESWKHIQLNMQGAKPPFKILSEQNKTTSLLRDLLNDDFNKIVTNDSTILKETKEYMLSISSSKGDIVLPHTANEPIFEHYGINKQVKSSFGKTVMLDNTAGYLIIEHTEALHVIDVNSGRKFSNENQEATALNTNLEAAKEIARQVRLRDLGGIVVVDFIDMKSPENKLAVSKAMTDFMMVDRARHTILPISKFGLLQITRQRLRPEIKISTGETCPSCEGTGKVRSSQLLLDDIESHVKYLTTNTNANIILHVHPILFSHFTKGLFFNTLASKWKRKYGKFAVVAEPSLEYLAYTFFDKNTGEELKF